MSNPFSLNGWLRRQPQPVAVLVERDGKESRIDVGKDGRNWKNLMQTLGGLAPYTRLQLLNGQGEVIRAKSFDEAEDEAPDASKDEESEIVVFARLLTEATKDQPILKHAMEFISTQSTTIARLMQECEHLRSDNNRLRLQVGQLQLPPTDDGGGDQGMMLLSTLVQGAQAGKIMQRPPLRRVSPKEGNK